MITDKPWVWYGAENPAVLACGHSHAISLAMTLRQSPIPNVAGVFSHPKPPEPTYWDRVIALPCTIAIVWQGNRHNNFMLRPKQGFSLYNADTGDPLVPEQMVRAYLSSTFPALEEIITRKQDCVLVGTPPTKSDAMIRRGLASRDGYAKQIEDMGLTVESVLITPLILRKGLWSIYQDLLSEIAARHGKPFIPVPSDAMNADGTLRDDLCSHDSTHATPAYGAIMWREILQRTAAPQIS